MKCVGFTKKGLPCKNSSRCHLHHQEHQDQLQGAGFLSSLKSAINFIPGRIKSALDGPRTGPTQRLTQFLEQHPQRVIRFEVARKPIVSGVKKALNFLSGGRFSSTAKRLGYDEVYHNYILFTLDDGNKIKLQKNHVVEAEYATDNDFNAERYDVSIVPSSQTMLQLITRSAKADGPEAEKRFWQYDPSSDNCQKFVETMVAKNGLSSNDPKGNELIQPQDAGALINSLTTLAGLPKAVTDLVATADKVVSGEGMLLRKGGNIIPSRVFQGLYHRQ